MEDFHKVLGKISALKDIPEPYVLKNLINLLRVAGTDEKSKKIANQKIESLIGLLRENSDYANGLASFLMTLINNHHHMSIFTDTGISNYGFSYNLTRLMSHRFIPLLPDDDSIIELVDYIFNGRDDELWLALIKNELWEELIDILSNSNFDKSLLNEATNNLLNAIVVLSYRINGLGLHQDLLSAYPEMLNFSAAFVSQNQEALLFTNQYRQKYGIGTPLIESPSADPSIKPLLVMLEQCDNFVNTIRKRIYKTGISIRLTNMLLRLEQSIDRLRNLSELASSQSSLRNKAILELTQAVIYSTNRRYSIRHLISANTELLSRKVTENAGRVGEHYISTDKSGFKKMFKKAAVGGFVIAFMATIKILSYDLELAPMGRAFINSMIYGLGFVFIHIIHGTVATKQPAMTAAAIASTVSQSSGKKSHQLAKLSELMVDILRTQFIAIMGNVLLAMPIAFIISYAWFEINGAPMIGFAKAEHLIEDLNPFTSLAIFHAAIAGVFLFLAGLIAGFYDNLAVFNHIGERISRHKLLLKVIPSRLTERLGRFVEANLGAIMGNFLFGVFLGSTATVGYIFGLPLDIRHIAFSSANFAHGFFNLDIDSFSFGLVLISILGVVLIGIINLIVSFSLALIVALRAKNVQSYEWWTLAKLVSKHFITHTRDFFWPRPEPMHYTHIDSGGHIIHQDTSTLTHLNPINKNGLGVRTLEDIRVVPDNVAIDNNKVNEALVRKELLKKIKDPKANEVTSKANKSKVLQNEGVDQSSGISDPRKDMSQYKDDKDYEQTSSSKNEASSKKNVGSLPKPDKPPNLPN